MENIHERFGRSNQFEKSIIIKDELLKVLYSYINSYWQQHKHTSLTDLKSAEKDNNKSNHNRKNKIADLK